jgi:hypothetical protein
MSKSKKQNHDFSDLEITSLQNSMPDVTHEDIPTANVKLKANISSQNADTGLPSYNSGDTRPYEQKNVSAGFHKSGVGSK